MLDVERTSPATEARAAKASLERPAALLGPSMEAIVDRANLKKALAQVRRNKGAGGIDGMSVEALPAYLKEHWPAIRAQLLKGTYKPQPVRRVEIPKASGDSVRSLQLRLRCNSPADLLARAEVIEGSESDDDCELNDQKTPP